MNFFSTASCVRFAPVLALALVVPVRVQAQENLSPPAGWTKRVGGGEVVFSQSGTGCRMVIKNLSPLNGSLRSWFIAQTERDSRTRGEVLSRGVVKARENRLSLVRSFRSAGNRETVAYLGYGVANQGRLVVSSGPTDAALSRSINQMMGVARQLGALDSATRRAASSTGRTTRINRRTATRPSGSSDTSGGIAASGGKGALKNAQIFGVYLDDSYGTGVGGMMIMTFDSVLLLRDGSARRRLEIPPLDLHGAKDKKANARFWGRWSRSGGKIIVRWPDGRTDDIRPTYKTRPARAGETLNVGYESLSGGGNTALGGNVMTFSSNAYQFARNGTFTTDKSGGGSSSATDTAGGVTVVANRSTSGRYRLDGHAITLRFNNGRTLRRLFYFYPDSKRAIGIGDSTFTIDD